MGDAQRALDVAPKRPFHWDALLPPLPIEGGGEATWELKFPSSNGGRWYIPKDPTYHDLIVLFRNHPDIWDKLHEDLQMPLSPLSENERERLVQLESRWERAKEKLRGLRYLTVAREALACLEMDGDGQPLEEAS